MLREKTVLEQSEQKQNTTISKHKMSLLVSLFLTLRDIKMNTCRDSHGIWSGRLREAG
jgi:ribosomal protein L31